MALSPLVSLAYAALAAAIFAFEVYRTRGRGADVISVFQILFILQCCIAGIAIFALLPLVDATAPTGVGAFDKILRETDLATAFLVFCLTAWFTFFLYVGSALAGCGLERLSSHAREQDHLAVLRVVVKRWRLLTVLAGGMALTLYSFLQFGDDWVQRYVNLVLYRGFEGDVERNALNANAFALTQTWSWLTVLGIFCFAATRWRRLVPVLVIAAAALAVLGVSRRAIFIPVLMIYLAIVLYGGRWRIRWALAAAVPMVLLVAFGKNILSTIAYGGDVDTVRATYGSWANAILRAAADIGITVVESLGTLQFLDMSPRLGVDHLISAVQIFPEKSLGLEIDFPERIVRLSTEAFDHAYAQDIPPGLFGQMWLDFRVLGPAIWGLALGMQIGVAQFFFRRVERTREAAALFVLIAFVIALPLNTGSFDFSFSVDIIALAAVLAWCVRFRRSVPVAAGVVAVPAREVLVSQN